MKNALKSAMPTVLAIVIGYIVIEGLKYGRKQWDNKQAMKRAMAEQAAAVAAAAAETEETN